jgi:predicted metal-binding protein
MHKDGVETAVENKRVVSVIRTLMECCGTYIYHRLRTLKKLNLPDENVYMCHVWYLQ